LAKWSCKSVLNFGVNRNESLITSRMHSRAIYLNWGQHIGQYSPTGGVVRCSNTQKQPIVRVFHDLLCLARHVFLTECVRQDFTATKGANHEESQQQHKR
jgi:hypothetical protein